jgi:choline dehydrogenase-like flavoprotein
VVSDMKPIQADWVLVGGSSAGCVLAVRLSEDPAREVVLLPTIAAAERLSDFIRGVPTAAAPQAAVSSGVPTAAAPQAATARGTI